MTTVVKVPEIPLATYVQGRRAELGISQGELSRRSGISTGWIGRLETGTIGQNPSLETLEKLAKGLRVPVDDLVRIARGEEAKPAEEVHEESLRRLIEITNSLPPDEREEVLEYARMRLRRLQEKRKE